MLFVLQITYSNYQAITSYKIKDPQLILVNLQIPQSCSDQTVKNYQIPFVAQVDNFTLNFFKGISTTSNNLSSLVKNLSGCMDKLNNITIQLEIPTNSTYFLQKKEVGDKCAQQCVQGTTSTACNKFIINNTSSTNLINIVTSPSYQIFNVKNNVIIQVLSIQFIIKMLAGKFQYPNQINCFGDNESIQLSRFLTQNIQLDTAIPCIAECVEVDKGLFVQGVSVNSIAQITELQYYFIWTGRDNQNDQFRSQTQSWFYYQGIQNKSGYFTAIQNWFKDQFK